MFHYTTLLTGIFVLAFNTISVERYFATEAKNVFWKMMPPNANASQAVITMIDLSVVQMALLIHRGVIYIGKLALKKYGECKQLNASKWKTLKTSSPLPISNSTTLIKNGQVEKKKNSISTEVPFTEKTTIQANSCDHSDFQILINNLMLYFHAKFAENYVGTVEHGKAFLVRLMFQTFNKNDDQIIDNEDLKQTGEDDRYHKLLPTGCDFTLLLRHGDVDSDGQLSLTEFMQIFGNSYKITKITTLIITTCATCLVEFQGLDSKSGKRRYQLIKKHIIETGTHYQLFCDVDHSLNPSLQVRWYRYDVPLISVAPNHFQISMDGSLYLTPAESVHHGNFTCKLGFHDEQVQIHIVNVVGKKTSDQFEAKFRTVENRGPMMTVTAAQMDDTGTYHCEATNEGGSSQASSSVVIRSQFEQSERYLRHNNKDDEAKFAVFYSNGVRIFYAEDCQLHKAIPTYSTGLDREHLCSTVNNSTEELKRATTAHCYWKDAVITQPALYLYAILAGRKAVVKINISNARIEEVLHTAFTPEKLTYIWWEDTVWVEQRDDDKASKLIVQLIKSASRPIQHSLTYVIPLREDVNPDLLFLPDETKTSYGYVGHIKEQALYKLNLHTMKISNRISLAPYDCSPLAVAFLGGAGLVAVRCGRQHNASLPEGQLLLDHLSDSALAFDISIHGIPTATDDERFLLTVEPKLGRFLLQEIVGKELKLKKVIDEFLPLTAWTSHTYNTDDGDLLYGLSSFSDKLIAVRSNATKIQRLFKVGKVKNRHNSSTFKANRNGEKLIETDRRGHYLVGAASNGIFVANLHNRSTPRCTVPHLRDIVLFFF
ncbi:Follistatin-related protein 5 [Trichinella nelsoni]|uniref:Follistatin-related protein 5 n=1 Tax=Trichinella nelsoni TaxID=6336 RepID=A0A0V0RMC0_9BILA|nr:Follistatin-related protein 5 [Trichinella nelsoni]